MRNHLHAALLATGSRLATRVMRAAREILLGGRLRADRRGRGRCLQPRGARRRPRPRSRRVRRAHVQSVCGWCDSKIAMPAGMATRGAVTQTSPLSHGICPSCVGARIAALPRPPLSGELP
jgi:hypothetical protein